MRTTGCPARLERRHGRVLLGVRRRGPHVDEEAIVAVALGRADGLEIDRDDPLAFLARRLGDQLLDPRAEARDVGRDAPASACRGRPRAARRSPRPARRRGSPATGTAAPEAAANSHARADQRADVRADERRRDQAEVRQRRVAPADVGRVDEHAPVVLLLGELAEARRRIGDGDEVRARASRRRRRVRASVFCQKWRSNAWISMVPPDFEATTNSVFLPAISASTRSDRRRIGVVEDVQRRPGRPAARRRR